MVAVLRCLHSCLLPTLRCLFWLIYVYLLFTFTVCWFPVYLYVVWFSCLFDLRCYSLFTLFGLLFAVIYPLPFVYPPFVVYPTFTLLATFCCSVGCCVVPQFVLLLRCYFVVVRYGYVAPLPLFGYVTFTYYIYVVGLRCLVGCTFTRTFAPLPGLPFVVGYVAHALRCYLLLYLCRSYLRLPFGWMPPPPFYLLFCIYVYLRYVLAFC